jgi:hypothetical protein
LTNLVFNLLILISKLHYDDRPNTCKSNDREDKKAPLASYNVAAIPSYSELRRQPSPEITNTQTKETYAGYQPPVLLPNRERFSRKVIPVRYQSYQSESEHDLMDSFEKFSAAEKLRRSDRQRFIARENKAIILDDLKKFGQSLQLRTPIPIDLISILSNDEDKERGLEASASQRALANKAESDKQDSKTPRTLQGGQKLANAPAPVQNPWKTPKNLRQQLYAPPTQQRQLYGNAALPPSISPTLRPPPAALRPPLVPVKSSVLPENRSHSQPQAKAVSETQSSREQLGQLPVPEQWKQGQFIIESADTKSQVKKRNKKNKRSGQ